MEIMSLRWNVLRNLILISQLAIHVLVPTFLCLMIGLWLDEKLETGYIALVLLTLGILAGGRNAYRMAMDSIREREKEDPQSIVDRVNNQKK